MTGATPTRPNIEQIAAAAREARRQMEQATGWGSDALDQALDAFDDLSMPASVEALTSYVLWLEEQAMPIRFTPTDTSASVSFIGADAPR